MKLKMKSQLKKWREKRTKERWGNSKVSKKRKGKSKINWAMFYSNYIKTMFNLRRKKAERKGVIQKMIKISDNYMTFDENQWGL
jgi:hypothetical protein